jgi:hypothetical protein
LTIWTTLRLLSAAAAQPPEPADDEPADRPLVYEEISVRERGDELTGIALSATEGSTGSLDLERRPLLRPGDLVETAPGVVATQHSGGGKANQYFLRGFNLDHGTDFRVTVAGVPVNMPSHGHGQGYADLAFLIPETVERVRFRKGPYYADQGDFSAAGAVDMELRRTLDHRIVSVEGGSDAYGRVLFADAFRAGSGDLLLALEGFHADGPWQRGDDYDGGKVAARYSRGDAQRGFSLTFLGYDADWLATDQVPRRLVESGQLDPFGLIDPGPRGRSSRFSLSAEATRGDDRSFSRLSAFALGYDLQLFGNFTYFLEDPERGDQHEQVDDRLAVGFDLRRVRTGRWGERAIETTIGVQARFDDIDNGLFRTADLARTATVRDDAIELFGGGPFAEASVRWLPKLKTVLGARLDGYWTEVESRSLGANSGSEDDLLLSPKLTVILGPWAESEIYANVGYGFHSNDARGATIRIDPTTGGPATPLDPLIRAKGIDLGLRNTAIEGLQTTLSLFSLELDSELVFVGDAGVTEAGRPSRRRGVEWASFYRLNHHLAADLDVTWTDAEFTAARDRAARGADDSPAGDLIPGSIEGTVAAGIAIEELGPWSASLRWRYFEGIPLIEDGSVEWDSSSVVNGQVSYTFENGLRLDLHVFNLFDSHDSDIEYFYPSRLPGEPLEGVEDVHFHPLERTAVRLGVSWRPASSAAGKRG